MKKITLLLLLSGLLAASCRQQDPVPSKPQSPAYLLADSLYKQGNDSAFYYFNRAATESKDSLEVARSYYFMGVIQFDASDYYGSQESLLSSLRYLKETRKDDLNCLAADYNELSMTSLHLGNFDAAISYADKALAFTKQEDRRSFILNSKATVYWKQGKHKAAIRIYRQILPALRKDENAYARTLSNLAITSWLDNPAYPALPQLHEALQIRKRLDDTWGLNASYTHLSTYFEKTRPDSALFYARLKYQVARQNQSTNDELDALQRLIVLSPAGQTKSYFERYRKMDDSVQLARTAAKNQFALIRYEAEKNKAENLLLQGENAKKNYQIVRQQLLLAAILILVVSSVIIARLWYKKRTQRQQLEAENAIRASQLKTSKKVHDVVANRLYTIMTTLDQKGRPEDGPLVDEMEQLYEKSRDILAEADEFSDLNFHESLKQMLDRFASDQRKVTLVGDTDLWSDVGTKQKFEVFHVLQELMVNMAKHSQASRVVVQAEGENNQVRLRYRDNGVGFRPGKKAGSGLRNTETRIKSIGGEISFDSGNDGLKVSISFPKT